MTKQSTKKKAFTEGQVLTMLDICYQKALEGINGISPPIETLAENYLEKAPDPSSAAKLMLRNQILKCTTSGFITGFGGIITLPVTIPANISSVIYVQMRMIACTAYMAGYDTNSDQVQTLIYACLAGVTVNSLFKKAGTKFGEKGLINLGKLVPGVGAIVSGGFDLVETKLIANRAYRWFFEGDFSVEQGQIDNDEKFIDAEIF